MPTSLNMVKSPHLGSSWAQVGECTPIVLLTGRVFKLSSKNIYVYTHSLVLFSILAREASLCGVQHIML